MKKFLMITAAAAAVAAAPASAQTWQGQTYSDQFATYELNATGQSFCKFGNSGNGTRLGANGANGPTINQGFAGGDASFILDIQNDSDNTVQEAGVAFDFARFVCNSPFTITGNSSNAGLKSTQTTSDTDFVQNIPVLVQVSLEGSLSGQATFQPGTTSATLVNSTEARAGNATIDLRVMAMDKLVLEGAYNESILLTMSPNLGS